MKGSNNEQSWDDLPG